MRCLTCGLVVTAALALLPTFAIAAEAAPAPVIHYDTPTFPTPFAAAIIGLSFTAVVCVGARVTSRTPGTMMYLVLASLVLTGTYVAAANRIHTNFSQTASHLHQSAAR